MGRWRLGQRRLGRGLRLLLPSSLDSSAASAALLLLRRLEQRRLGPRWLGWRLGRRLGWWLAIEIARTSSLSGRSRGRPASRGSDRRGDARHHAGLDSPSRARAGWSCTIALNVSAW